MLNVGRRLRSDGTVKRWVRRRSPSPKDCACVHVLVIPQDACREDANN
jgi:hypothetical protein